MALIVRTNVCVICGAEFETKSKYAKYCSLSCKKIAQRIHNRNYEQTIKNHRERMQQLLIAQRTPKEQKPTCRGCEWKTPGWPQCVMPTCMKEALAKKEEEDNVV